MRSCGTCSLCCKVMGVPEVKENFKWCKHCKLPGGGCGIYDTRPKLCRDFHCQWLVDQRFPDYWFPKTAKIVADHRVDGEQAYVYFVVDPDYPNRWREEPWFADIMRIAKLGAIGAAGVKWITLVLIKDERILIGL